MSATDIIQVIDGIKLHVENAEVKAEYPLLNNVHINLYDDPDIEQCPAMDFFPIQVEVMGETTSRGNAGEHAEALIEVALTNYAAQYETAVRDAFNRADQLRRALNINMGAIRAGCSWLKFERATQVEPDVARGRAFINLRAQIRCGFAIERY